MSRTFRTASSALLLGALVLVAVACGGDDNGGTVADGPTSSAAGVDIALVIDVSDGGAAGAPHASITCQGGNAIGTGYLLDATAAAAACAVLTSDAAVQARLTKGPPTGLACTQQYGGPETASITGTLLGKAVHASLDRKDGCGIADWNALGAVLHR